MEIMTEWTCEELLVAYGVYMNQRSQSNYEMMSAEEKKRKRIGDMERWAIPFISYRQLDELENQAQEQSEKFDELEAIGSALFGDGYGFEF